MTTRLLFSQRICSRSPHVLLAAHLSPDPVDEEDPASLRADASRDGLCFVRVIRSLADGTYLVRVAADPDLLTCNQSYTVLLSEEQLASALPWDSRLQARPPEHVSALLGRSSPPMDPAPARTRQDGQAGRSKPPSSPPLPDRSAPCGIGDGTPGAEVSMMQHASAQPETRPLPHVFVSRADYQRALAATEPLPGKVGDGHRPTHCKTCQRRWLSRVMLRAALAVLEKAHSHAPMPVMRCLFERLRQAILRVGASFGCFTERLVHLSEVYRGKQHLGWYVQVDVPLALVA